MVACHVGPDARVFPHLSFSLCLSLSLSLSLSSLSLSLYIHVRCSTTNVIMLDAAKAFD